MLPSMKYVKSRLKKRYVYGFFAWTRVQVRVEYLLTIPVLQSNKMILHPNPFFLVPTGEKFAIEGTAIGRKRLIAANKIIPEIIKKRVFNTFFILFIKRKFIR